jgi:hypothetical protein
MKHRSHAGLAAGLVATALVAAPAPAAEPVTVDLRIEGPTRTLFEGKVTTGVRPFRFTGDATAHRCDGTTTGGSSLKPVATRGAAIAAAAETAPFSIAGTWHPDFGASFTSIAGESVAFDAATGRFLGEYENGAFAQVGACADPIETGDEVLFAYGDGSETLLALTGPARARPARKVTVRVTDAASGAPVAGARVAGRTTGADGRVTVGPFGVRRAKYLKARKPGAIRSNRLRICITLRPCRRGDRTAPLARIRGIPDGRRFARGPRLLRGTVAPDPAGLRAVRLSLTRRVGDRCWSYSGRRERFVRRRCGRRIAFTVGHEREWSYLLPARLPHGRYVLQAIAVDQAGNRDSVQRGRNRVRFRVR